MKTSFLLLIMLIFSSCSKEENQSLKGVLPQEQMVEVFYGEGEPEGFQKYY